MNHPRTLERLRWRCRRGLLELDVILQRFLVERFSTLSPCEQAAFGYLLTMSDDLLLAYLQGRVKAIDRRLRNIVKKIK